jgi:acyl-CoA-binding protein
MREVDVPQHSLNKIFHLATQFVTQTKVQVCDHTKLQLYAYYKQATVGDCTADKPAVWEMVAKAKW